MTKHPTPFAVINDNVDGAFESSVCSGSSSSSQKRRKSKVKQMIKMFSTKSDKPDKMSKSDKPPRSTKPPKPEKSGPGAFSSKVTRGAMKQLLREKRTHQPMALSVASSPSPTEDNSFDRPETILDISDQIVDLSLASTYSARINTPPTPPIDCENVSPIQLDGSRTSTTNEFDDEKNNYSSLIRDLETTPDVDVDPNAESVRKLDFESPNATPKSSPADKRVVVEDSLNTLRFFARSDEEHETCFGPKKELKQTSGSSTKEEDIAYSEPLQISPVKASTTQGAEQAGFSDFISWAEVENATNIMKESFKDSSKMLTQAMSALTASDRALQIPGIDLKESWDERTVQFKNSIDESSTKIRSSWKESQLKASLDEHSAKFKPVLDENLAKLTEKLPSMGPACICSSAVEHSMELEIQQEEGIEVTAPDEYGFGEIVMDPSFNSNHSGSSDSFFSGFSETTPEVETKTDRVSSMLNSVQPTKASLAKEVQCFQSLVDVSYESEDTPSDEEKDKETKDRKGSEGFRARARKLEKAELTRKLRVVQSAKRWSEATQGPEPSSLPPRAPPRAPPPPPPPPPAVGQDNFFVCEFNELQPPVAPRPLLLEMEDPWAPTTSHSAPIPKLTSEEKKVAADFFKTIDISTRSPQSALDL